MTLRTLATLTQRALEHPQASAVNFIWHGGEPLVRGRAFYAKALYLQDRCRRPGQGVQNSLQTNGTLVDEDWVRFLKENNFSVGLSIDGPQEVHDAQRFRAGGQGSHDAVMRALRLFQKHDLRFGALVVVTEAALELGPEAMFDFLVSNGLTSFAFLRLRPESLPDGTYEADVDYMSRHRYEGFIRRIFDLWLERDDPDLRIREFDSIVSMLFGGHASICTLAGNCIGRHLGVNVNGDIYHCDRYVSDLDYRLGNVHRQTFSEMFHGDKLATLRTRNEERLSGYGACEWNRICNGGCPHNTYIERRSTGGTDVACCGEAGLISHINARVKEKMQPALAA
jgi:uncharacterized protein